MNNLLSGRSIETKVIYRDFGYWTGRFATYRVTAGIQTGSTEGAMVARILELVQGITEMSEMYRKVEKQAPTNADTVLTEITRKIQADLTAIKNAKKNFYKEFEAWGDGTAPLGRLIRLWAGHPKIGLLNTEIRTLELDTGNIVYVQLGQPNKDHFDNSKPVSKGEVRHNVERNLGQ